MKNIIIFLGYGTKKETFVKKDIYKYLQKQGKIIIPNINYKYSLKQNIENINFEKNKKYVLIGHSIGAFFVYYLNQKLKKYIDFSILFDPSLITKSYYKNFDNNDNLVKYFNELDNNFKFNKYIYTFRNIETKSNSKMLKNSPHWTKYCIEEAEYLKKVNVKMIYFLVYDVGHNFYISKKGFSKIKNNLDLIFL